MCLLSWHSSKLSAFHFNTIPCTCCAQNICGMTGTHPPPPNSGKHVEQFNGGGNWVLKRLGKLPKVTQLVNDSACWKILFFFFFCKLLEDSWDYKEIKPVNPKGNQPWVFIGRTEAEVEAPILRSPDRNSQLNGKDPDAGKDWQQEEKRVLEDDMVR